MGEGLGDQGFQDPVFERCGKIRTQEGRASLAVPRHSPAWQLPPGMTLGPSTGGSRRSPVTEHLSCKLENQLLVCMTFACPHHAQVPHVESSLGWGGRRTVRGAAVLPACGRRGRWEKEAVRRGHSHLRPSHATPGCVSGGLGLDPLSCSPQLMQLSSLHRPRHPPASRPHGPEPRHSHPRATPTVRSRPTSLSLLTPHGDQGSRNSPVPTTGTLPQPGEFITT